MTASESSFPTPKVVEGGCLCRALRYRINFPDNHDFKEASGTCQCTQCRRQSGAFFLCFHNVKPISALTWLSDTSTLKIYSASPEADRGFCSECGSWLYWKPKSDECISMTVGTIDPLYLLGEDAEGKGIPQGGFGVALAGGEGHHYYRVNDIPGITDKMEYFSKGTSFPEGSG
ncbi:hypothetical protein GQ53DRAFT_657071 [Thozetella sp. PMI_491]|nr:hypothetical protein GQ53DRAFT_657071 [Thozetella sp. PMI_491]